MKHNYSNEYMNVRIRQLCENDIENLRSWRNDSNNTRFLRQIPFITSEMQKIWFDNYLNDNSEITFAIDEINELNRTVGSMSLYNFDGDTAEFGKILIGDNDAHGKHVGVNAIEALKKIACEDLGLSELYLHVFTDNIIAVKVYEKAGFKIIDKHQTSDGIYEYTMKLFLKRG